MSLVFDRAVSPTPHHYVIQGRAAEIARSLGSPAGGPEHMFLAMLHDGGWPVDVDAPLRRALAGALPGSTTFALGSEDEGAWVCVLGPGDSSDPAVTREVLNAALTSLNRPTAGG